jgi:hypothetical protein
MADGVQTEAETEESGVVETTLGGKEFRGTIEATDPTAPKLTPAPEGVPEKFWDPVEGKLRTEDLIKSYSELEKRIGAPKEDAAEASEEDDEDGQEGSEEEAQEGADEDPDGEQDGGEEEQEGDDNDAEPAAFEAAVAAAQAVYAETGDLDEEARAPLKKLGINDEQINFYIEGVKAKEAALQGAAVDAAGSAEDLQAAMAWAGAGGWSKKAIIAFNAQMGEVETVGPAVAGLMAAFRKAEPGEGRLTNKTTGLSRGDVYESMDEFSQDLAKADKLRDKVARKKAIDKLARSRAAGTIQSEQRHIRR